MVGAWQQAVMVAGTGSQELLCSTTSRKQRAISELSKEFALYDILSLPQCHTFYNKVILNELPSFINWGLSI